MARTNMSSKRSSNGEGTSFNNQEQDHSDTAHKRKTRGPSMGNTDWALDPDKCIRVEFNEHGQPIGDHAAGFVSSSGVLARMGKYYYITKNDWREFSYPMKEKLMDYMKEHFIFPEEKDAYKTCERVLLQSIGHKLKTWKNRLREFIDIDLENGCFETEIYVHVPKGAEKAQWKDFVDITLSEAFKEKSKKTKVYRKQQTEVHIGKSNRWTNG